MYFFKVLGNPVVTWYIEVVPLGAFFLPHIVFSFQPRLRPRGNMKTLENNFVVTETGTIFNKLRKHKTEIHLTSRKNVLKEDTDLCFLVNTYAVIGKLIGVQRLKWSGDKVTCVGTMYKAYAVVLVTCLTILSAWKILSEASILFDGFPPPAIVTSVLQHVFAMFASFAIVIQSALRNPKISLKIYECLNEVDKMLIPNLQADINLLKIGVICIHVMYFIIEVGIVFSVIDCWQRMLAYSFFCSMAYIISVVALQFSVEICAISRRFEFLNQRLKNIKIVVNEEEMNPRTAVNFEIQDGILMKLWGKRHYKCLHPSLPVPPRETSQKVDDEVEELLAVYNKLADIVDYFNSCYGLAILCSTVYSFLNFLATINLFIVPMNSNEVVQIFSFVAWGSHQMLAVLGYTTTCEILQHETYKTGVIVNKLLTASAIDADTELLERFAALLHHRQLRITAHNFFTVDYSFVYALIGTLVSYTIILRQLSQKFEKPAE